MVSVRAGKERRIPSGAVLTDRLTAVFNRYRTKADDDGLLLYSDKTLRVWSSAMEILRGANDNTLVNDKHHSHTLVVSLAS